MSRIVDLSHVIENGTTGARIRLKNGHVREASIRIEPWLTREQLREAIHDEAAFEITEVSFPTIIGTYIDSPYSRFADGRDISELSIEDVVLPGIAIDARGLEPGSRIGPETLPTDVDLRGTAILVNFGWDRFWGRDEYLCHPSVSDKFVDQIIESGARLLGVDTGNADAYTDPAHPVHNRLLAQDMVISENLTNLHLLHSQKFRFFAVPIKGRRMASMSVRAFAEITE